MKLELQQIKKSFDGKEILHGVNFSVEGGNALGLLGRNGAGKTTTIRIIMDVFHADSGEVLFDGEPFKYQPGQVGYLPEERGLYPKRIISEQLIYLAMLRGLDRKQAEPNMKKWLARLDVAQYEKKKLDTLSKGNQQKVQLAATLVANPDIVILDEPFSGLDPVNSQILKDVIHELIAEKKIVIFSSHQMSYVEEFCEDIVIINHGEVALSGHLDDIKQTYGEGHKAVSATDMEPSELAALLKEKAEDILQVITTKKHDVIIQMKDGVDQWQILERFQKLGIGLRSFGVYEPSLNDIFVSAVGEEDTAEDVKRKNNIGTSFSDFEPEKKKGRFGFGKRG